MRCHEPRAPSRKLAPAGAVLAALTLLATAPAGAVPLTVRPDSTLALLALTIDRAPTDVTLSAYQDSGHVWVPLGQLVRALGLAIQVDPARGAASGIVLDESHRFALDLDAGTVLVNGASARLPAGAAELHDDDLYVEIAALSAWLPLDLAVDTRQAMLVVHPRAPLPAQRRAERDLSSRRALAASPRPDEIVPARAAPYRAIDWPTLQQTLQLSRRSEAYGDSPMLQGSLDAAGDLLWMEARGHAYADDRRGPADAHLTLRRAESEPTLLGPLHAREIELGDVFDPGDERMALPRSGRGLALTSVPATAPVEFGHVNLEGERLADWDVELYRNGALVGYEPAGPSGGYRFTEVPVSYGLNEFQIVSHGPQGQSRSETRRMNLGTSLTPAGQWTYRALAYAPPGAPGRAEAEVNTGLASRLSASARVLASDLNGRASPFLGAGLRGGWSGVFATGDVAAGSARGRMLATSLATRVAGLGIWGQWAGLDRYRSETYEPALGPVRRRTSLRLDGGVPLAFGRPLAASVEWRGDRFAEGGAIDRWTQITSVSLGGIACTNRLERVRTAAPGATSSETHGALIASRGGQGLLVRGELDYGHGPSSAPGALSLAVESSRRVGYAFEAGIQRGPGTRSLSGHVSLGRLDGPVRAQLRTDYAQQAGASASLVLSLELSRDPRDGRWRAESPAPTSAAAASVDVFLDANGNGVWDGGEPPIRDVTLRADPPGIEAATGADGRARLRPLPTGVPVRVQVLAGSLPDPMWMPESGMVALLPRPGAPTRAEIPVTPTGEITGTARAIPAGADHGGEGRVRASRPVSSLPLELIDVASGATARRAFTAYDGYYDFVGLRPGRYRLRVAPEASVRLRLEGAPRDVEVPANGALIEGVDLALTNVEPAVAGESDGGR